MKTITAENEKILAVNENTRETELSENDLDQVSGGYTVYKVRVYTKGTKPAVKILAPVLPSVLTFDLPFDGKVLGFHAITRLPSVRVYL